MAIVNGTFFGREIVEALGIPMEDVVGIEIRSYVEEIVTIKVEYFPHKEGLDKLIPIIKKYHLEEDKLVEENIQDNT